MIRKLALLLALMLSLSSCGIYSFSGTSTQPDVFFESYFSGKPFADVERMFFVCESYGVDRWEERSRKAGIMFDRTRIMEYVPVNIDANLLGRITQWNQAAIACVRQDI